MYFLAGSSFTPVSFASMCPAKLNESPSTKRDFRLLPAEPLRSDCEGRVDSLVPEGLTGHAFDFEVGLRRPGVATWLCRDLSVMRFCVTRWLTVRASGPQNSPLARKLSCVAGRHRSTSWNSDSRKGTRVTAWCVPTHLSRLVDRYCMAKSVDFRALLECWLYRLHRLSFSTA